jgi:hypothetical protein
MFTVNVKLLAPEHLDLKNYNATVCPHLDSKFYYQSSSSLAARRREIKRRGSKQKDDG